ncbi:hypothetical protein QBC38DRAFT_545867 [Podospora fimiseda]|uniref:Zn(2)-C6 fungal-type domain-containing protein n=1 Tax=Podospora fimiseda TaxID=252190 RepID=A0AAN7BNI8_9PEZI|nr:hypothetical protein QBC38DRAFT_545867 [Podospora fimiseda]
MEMAEYSSNPITNDSDRSTDNTATTTAPSFAPGTSSSGEILACFLCKRRKVKCDRQLPNCSLCRKLNLNCEYPAYAGRPGPKPDVDDVSVPRSHTLGSQGTKRRRLDTHHHHHHQSGPSTTSSHDLPSRSAGPGPSSPYDYTPRNSAASPAASGYSSSANPDDSISRRDNPTPDDGGSVQSPSSTKGGDRRLSNHSTAPKFSRIMYPSHEEVQGRSQSPNSPVETPSDRQGGGPKITIQTVCDALRISRNAYNLLMTSYFDNMTAFTLFKPGGIEPKFAMMQYHSEAEALVAAMFSFSARHCRDEINNSEIPSPAHFARVASNKLDESVNNYGDVSPHFWLLQANILITFYQLTSAVRYRSWMKLGECVRYCYDVNLHLVDANYDPTEPPEKINIERWSLLEERRRAWWAVWEMDIYASTLRRLPPAIKSSMNLTLLPVPDTNWFNDIYQESSFLVPDSNLRWKHLSNSGNTSAKAWFIVVNSLTNNTQRIVYPAGSALKMFLDKSNGPGVEPSRGNQDELNIMANCLYCTITSLPSNSVYQGEALHFRLPKHTRQAHADKYSIHLMIQLCRFMIYHHKICVKAPWLKPGSSSASHSFLSDNDKTSNSEWQNYMNAADEIVTVVRNSSRDHHRYVNPFLVNTVWFSAAVQIACRVFGPKSFNPRLAESNLDLIRLTMERYVQFWGGMESLKQKLERIENALASLMISKEEEEKGRIEEKEKRVKDEDQEEDTAGAAESRRSSAMAVSGLVIQEQQHPTTTMAIDNVVVPSPTAATVLGSNAAALPGHHPAAIMAPPPPPPHPPAAAAAAAPAWPFATVPGGHADVPMDYLNFGDYPQPFLGMTGQHFFGPGEGAHGHGQGPIDFHYGLENVFMSGIDHSQFRGGGGGAGAGAGGPGGGGAGGGFHFGR